MFFSETKINNDNFLSFLKFPGKRITSYPDFNISLPYYELESFIHILEMSIDKKINESFLKDIFKKKILPIINHELDFLNSKRKSGGFFSTTYKKNISQDDLNDYINSFSNKPKFILCRSMEYPLFLDIDYDSNTIYLNIDWYENNAGFNASNLNLIISTVIYAYSILNKDKMKCNSYDLFPLSELVYVLFMNTLGRKEGLSIATLENKHVFYLSILATIMSKFLSLNGSEKPTSSLIRTSLNKAAADLELNIQYFIKTVSGFAMYDSNDIFNPVNWDSFSKLFHILRRADIIKSSDIKLAINVIKYIRFYGMTALLGYPWFISYIAATIYPNSQFTSIMKTYSRSLYKSLIELSLKKIYRM